MTIKPHTDAARRIATFAPIAFVGILLLAAVAPSANAATLVNVDVSAPKQRANVVETWWFQMTTVGAIPKAGDIQVTFPPGFNASFGGTSRCDIHMPTSVVTENTTI